MWAPAAGIDGTSSLWYALLIFSLVLFSPSPCEVTTVVFSHSLPMWAPAAGIDGTSSLWYVSSPLLSLLPRDDDDAADMAIACCCSLRCNIRSLASLPSRASRDISPCLFFLIRTAKSRRKADDWAASSEGLKRPLASKSIFRPFSGATSPFVARVVPPQLY